MPFKDAAPGSSLFIFHQIRSICWEKSDWTCCILQLYSSSFSTPLVHLVRIIPSLYSPGRGETVQNPEGQGCDPPARRSAGRAGDARGGAVFPPQNGTEQRSPATLPDKGKEKQKAKPPRRHRARRANWAGGSAGGWGGGPGLLTPPAQRCPGRGQGTSRQRRAQGCGCCWGPCVPVPKASSERPLPRAACSPAAPPAWPPLRGEHRQHPPSPPVLPSNMLSALQAPKRSL